MEQIKIEISDLDDYGLDEAFQNWLSTVVDVVNTDLQTIENVFATLGQVVQLTRCDTSASSNITMSDDFKKFVGKLIDKINHLEQRIKVLGG